MTSMQCRACSMTFREPLPDVGEKRSMTPRLIEWIGKQAIKRTFASLAEEVVIDESAVRSAFRERPSAQGRRRDFS